VRGRSKTLTGQGLKIRYCGWILRGERSERAPGGGRTVRGGGRIITEKKIGRCERKKSWEMASQRSFAMSGLKQQQGREGGGKI